MKRVQASKAARLGSSWIKRDLARRDAEKDLCFALGKLQDGDLPAAYVNALMAAIRIGKEMSEAQHQAILLDISQAAP